MLSFSLQSLQMFLSKICERKWKSTKLIEKIETHKEKDDWKLYKYLMNKGLFCTLVVIISFHSYLLEMKSFIVWKFSESSLLSFCKIMCFESKFLDIKQNIWLDLLGNRLEENNLVVFRIPFYLTTQYFDLCLRTD